MPEFLKRLFRTGERVTGEKFLNYDGLGHLVKRLTESSCDRLLAATSSEEETTVYLNQSMSRYKKMTLMLIVEDRIKNTVTIPVPIVQSGKIIEMAYPVDFGEMSAHIYYYSDNMLRIRTSMASVDIWGTN